MAIDFMVLPFSRYIAGDFVTPAMRAAWSLGVPYAVLTPDGRRDCPEDIPFGGRDASARRTQILPMVMDDLGQLPLPASSLWDEASAAEPAFHRVDPASYEALLAEAPARRTGGWLSSLFRRAPRAHTHLTATLFLPCAFDLPFAMTSPFARVAGSIERARAELADAGWTAASQAARETLEEALVDAARLRLPMIVDS